MLVEDDNNLREIYEARLTAEGYTIVAAQDGEAALALAAQERPDLVITDVMMPKISGFEMLDILRNTENLRDVKVIMLTALGQAEDNARANALGADRYLVKSQVTLEDIVKAAHDLIDGPTAPVATPSPAPVATEPVAVVEPQPVAQAPAPAPITPTAAVAPAVNDLPSQASELPISPAPQPGSAFTPSTPQPAPPAPVSGLNDWDLSTSSVFPTQPAQATQPAQPPVVSQDPVAAVTNDTLPLDAPAPPTTQMPVDAPQPDYIPASQPIDSPATVVEQTVETPVPTELPQPSTEAPYEAQAETDMRDQIDQYLQTAGSGQSQTPVEQASETPATYAPPAEPVFNPEYTAEPITPVVPTDPTPSEDATELPNITDTELGQYHLQPIDDQNEAEYARDENTPDMGQMSLHAPEAPLSDAAPAYAPAETDTPSAFASPVSDPYASDMPVMPAPVETQQAVSTPEQYPQSAAPAQYQTAPAPQPENPESDMPTPPQDAQPAPMDTAQTSLAAVAPAGYPSQPYQFSALPTADVSEPSQPSASDQVVSSAVDDMVASTQPPAPADLSAPVDAAPQTAASNDETPRRRIIQPISTERPDIHQLLAAEEAKNSAVQASMQPQAPATQDGGVDALGQPWQPLPQVDNRPRADRYNSDVDPNSISL